MATGRTVKIQQTDTDVAVLYVQVQNIEDKVVEIKEELKDVRYSIDRSTTSTEALIKELKDSSATAHRGLSDKISTLEKWRWMMMGAGLVLGSYGFEIASKLLK